MKNNQEWLADILKGIGQPQQEELPSPLLRQPVAFTEPEQITAQAPVQIRPELPMMYKNSREMLPLPPELQQELPPVAAKQEEPKGPSLEQLLSNINAKDGSNELRSAQNSRNDELNQLLMLKGINKMALSQASQTIDPDFLKENMDMARTKVPDAKDILTEGRTAQDQTNKLRKNFTDEKKAVMDIGDKDKENDPKSELSKSFREFKNKYYEEMGSKVRVGENLAYADLAKSTGALDQSIMVAYNARLRQQDHARADAASREDKADAKAAKSETKNLDWADKTATTLNKNPFIANYSKIKQNALAFDNAMKNPSGVTDIGALYSYVKFLDQDSAVREGEIDLLMKAVGGFDKVKLAIDKAFTSGASARVLPDNIIKAMAQANDILKRNLSKNVNSELKRIELQADSRGADIRTAVPGYDILKKELEPAEDTDPRIDAFMSKNGIKDRNEAISILKKAELL